MQSYALSPRGIPLLQQADTTMAEMWHPTMKALQNLVASAGECLLEYPGYGIFFMDPQERKGPCPVPTFPGTAVAATSKERAEQARLTEVFKLYMMARDVFLEVCPPDLVAAVTSTPPYDGPLSMSLEALITLVRTSVGDVSSIALEQLFSKLDDMWDPSIRTFAQHANRFVLNVNQVTRCGGSLNEATAVKLL